MAGGGEPGGRADVRPLAVALAAAWLMVVARSFVYFAYPQSFFDSDQAIVGLMAKHLVEGRAVPLFYYGQGYLLAVDAWIAAPFFLVAGPTLAALRASIVATNLVVVTLILVGFARAGLRPLYALAAVSFVAFAPPVTAASLVELGANIGPLLFVPLLWFLRRRPIWFGSVLAIGFLNRDFTIYAAPVLVAGDAIAGALFTRARLRAWASAAAAFLVVWGAITAMKPLADLRGPGSRGEPVEGATGSQIENIVAHLTVEPAELPGRAAAMATHHFPRQVGAVAASEPYASQGRDALYWPLMLVLAAGLGRALWFGRHRFGIGWYVAGVGLTAAVVYVLTRPVDPVIDRYLLLTLFLPAGIVATWLAVEPRAWLRRAGMFAMAIWCGLSALDHARLGARYRGNTEPDHIQILADGLVARGITVAKAGYWRAYKVTFIAGERVKVASSDLVRIDEYQRLADAAGPALLTIEDQRRGECPGGLAIGIWRLCPQGR
jgi:hypothetical protein